MNKINKLNKDIVFENTLFECENEMTLSNLLRNSSKVRTPREIKETEDEQHEWIEHCKQMRKEAEERRKEEERIQQEEDERERLYQLELQKQKEEQEKIEEQKRIEEEIERHEEEQFLNKIEEKQIIKIERDFKKGKYGKLELGKSVNFSNEIKALYPLPNVSYFDRQNLRSKESMFLYIDSSNYDNLQTDAWSSIQYKCEDWVEIQYDGDEIVSPTNEFQNKQINMEILKDNYHVEINNNWVTYTDEYRNFKYPIVYIENEFPFYEQYFYNKKNIKHYLDKENCILLSVDENRKYKKAILRTPNGFERLIIPPDVDILKYKGIFSKGSKVQKLSNSSQIDNNLLTMEQRTINTKYKFGVVYVRKNQNEDGIFGNDEIPKDFYELMFLIADKVPLQNFGFFNGGLDVKHNQTGTSSFYTKYMGNEIMFHVAPMLPCNENDPQKLERKRHIGNDIVVLVYLENGVTDFDPRVFKSHFNHVFVIIQPLNRNEINDLLISNESMNDSDSMMSSISTILNSSFSDGSFDPLNCESDISLKHIIGNDKSTLNTAVLHDRYYRVSVVTKGSVIPFPPYLQSGIFAMDLSLRDFLLQKLINGERTALINPPFSTNSIKTRKTQIEFFSSML